jgi:predicted house-cleaning noncanonical NTP pyrophosphatase (MazG superfamily)
MNEYNKILRDNVANSLQELKDEYNVCSLNKKETLEYLYSNLISSIYDMYNTKSLNNIVDCLDLIISIANEYGYSENKINELKEIMNAELGAFSNKIILNSNKTL